MTKLDTLIAQLAADGATPRAHSLWRFVAPLLAVIALCVLGTVALLDEAFPSVPYAGPGPIMVKWGFSIALIMLSAIALWVLGKPGSKATITLLTLAVPFILAGVLLVVDLFLAEQIFPGATWRQCLVAMAVMSPIAFAGAIMATRWLAPTNLRSAGFAAGLFGGAVAMTAYAPFCPELGMAYMAVFYCLPILVMAGLGWMTGPKLLRW